MKMELERENKRLKILIIVILIIILLLGAVGYIFYINHSNNNENKKETITNNKIVEINENKVYSYKDMIGTYKIEKTADIDGQKVEGSYTLYLFDDGSFKTVYNSFAPMGYIGNYIIEGNEIRLNYLFETNSGTGLRVVKGNKSLTIIDKNSIEVISVNEYSDFDFSGTMNRIESDDLENYNLSDVLDNNDFFSNRASDMRNNG